MNIVAMLVVAGIGLTLYALCTGIKAANHWTYNEFELEKRAARVARISLFIAFGCFMIAAGLGIAP
jgi:hypothetical protein